MSNGSRREPDAPVAGASAGDSPPKQRPQRREVLSRLGTGAVAAAVGVPALLAVRSLVPNALYERPRRFKAGKPDQFAQGATFLAAGRVFIFRQDKIFHCVSAVCTHLGCTVQLVKIDRAAAGEEIEFHCPCHGSKFRADGTNYAGPAPRPLNYYRLALAPDDGQLIVDTSQTADKDWRFSA